MKDDTCRHCGDPIEPDDSGVPMFEWQHKDGRVFCDAIKGQSSTLASPLEGVAAVKNERDYDYHNDYEYNVRCTDCSHIGFDWAKISKVCMTCVNHGGKKKNWVPEGAAGVSNERD